MKTNSKISNFLVFPFLLLFSAHPSPVSAEAASKHQGRLKILFGDDFKQKKHQTLYYLESSDSADVDGTDHPRHQPLDFEGNTPAELQAGQALEITAFPKGGHGRLSVQSHKILASVPDPAPAPGLIASPTGTPDYHGPMSTYTATPTCKRTCLAILLNFSDKNLACSPSEVDSVAFSSPTSVSNFYRENTFNGLGLQGTTIGPFTIPYSSATCDPYAYAAAANQAAAAAGYNVASYNHVMYVLPEAACGYGGLGELSASRTWLFYCNWTEVFAHELGHNLGMHHASCGTQEYGDDSDVMGYNLRDLNAPHKAELASKVCFNHPPKIDPVVQCGVYTLYALETPSDNDSILKIAKPATGGYLWVSYRVPTDVDSALSPTYAYKSNIHDWPGTNWTQTHFLAAEGDGSSYFDAANNITITQLSHDQYSCRVSVTLGVCPPTATPTATATYTSTPVNTNTAISTPTSTVTLTSTSTPTSIPSTPTPTATNTKTATPLPTPSSTPTSAPSLEPTSPPSSVPSPTPVPEACPAQIDKIMITPNPQQSCADRMVSIKLGCPADEVDVQIYSASGALLFSWAVTDNVHVQRGQWVHLKYPHEVQLPNGTYFVKVAVKGGGTTANGSATFVVLN